MEKLKKLETEKFELIERRKDIKKRIKERQTKEEKEFEAKKEEVKTQLLENKKEITKEYKKNTRKFWIAGALVLLSIGATVGAVIIPGVALQIISGCLAVGSMLGSFVSIVYALPELRNIEEKAKTHNKEAQKYNAMQFEKSGYLKSLEADLENVNLKIKNLDTEAKNYVYSIKAKQQAIKTQERINKQVANSKLIKEYNQLTNSNEKV